METRTKVRVLLINPTGNILLMRIEDPSLTGSDLKGQKSCWITIGGSIEANETIEEAGRREAHEETGISDIEIAAFREYREVVFEVNGTQVLFKETYIAATTNSWDHDYSNWTEDERQNVKEMRWWSLQDISASDEIIFPPDLAAMMQQALAVLL